MPSNEHTSSLASKTSLCLYIQKWWGRNLRRNFQKRIMFKTLIFKRFSHAVPKLQDVVIVGGGPAGLSILTALKNSTKTSHLQCKLIEGSDLDKVRNFNDEAYSNRIISLTNKSMKFMQKIGSFDHLDLDRMQFYESLVAFDSESHNSCVSFENDSEDLPMGAMCEVINIQKSLLDRIDELEATEDVIDNVRVESIEQGQDSDVDWPIVKLSNGDAYQTRLLIGADGYNSPVRKYAGIESRGWSYDSWGTVGVVTLDSDEYNSNLLQRFLTTGPLALLPLPEDKATFVWSCKNDVAKILKSVQNDDIFVALLNAGLRLSEVDLQYVWKKLEKDPEDVSVIADLQWRLEEFVNPNDDLELPTIIGFQKGSRAQFPLKMSHVDSYISSRVALIGDAAHTTHPLAGQGLNLGQGDVQELTTAIENGVTRGLDIGTPLVLEPYFSNSYPMNHAVIGVCDKLHKLFSNDVYPVKLLRNFGLRAFNFVSPIKDLLVKTLSA